MVEQIQKPMWRASDGKEFFSTDEAEAWEANLLAGERIKQFTEHAASEGIYKGRTITLVRNALTAYEQFLVAKAEGQRQASRDLSERSE